MMCTLNASKINFATFKKEFDLKDLTLKKWKYYDKEGQKWKTACGKDSEALMICQHLFKFLIESFSKQFTCYIWDYKSFWNIELVNSEINAIQ